MWSSDDIMRINQKIDKETCFSKNIFFLILMASAPMLGVMFLRDQPSMSMLFLFLLICWSFYVGYDYYKQNKKFGSTYKWERIEAKVTKKRVFHLNCMSINFRMSPYRIKTHGYRVDITYKYEINGKEYKSNQYSWAYNGDADCNYLYTLEEAKKIMHRLTKDKKIKIYINPHNPQESVIVRGKSLWYAFPHGLLSVYIIVLFYLIYRVYAW